MDYYYLGCFSICPSLQLPPPPSPFVDKYHRADTSYVIFFLAKVSPALNSVCGRSLACPLF